MTGKRTQIIVVSSVLAFHLLVFVGSYFTTKEDFVTTHPVWNDLRDAALASQPGLIAIWVSVSKLKSYIRFPLCLGFSFLYWYLISLNNTSPGMHLFGSEITQFLVVIFLIFLVKWIKWAWLIWRNGILPEYASQLQFTVHFLLAWMVALALMLGCGKILWTYNSCSIHWSMSFSYDVPWGIRRAFCDLIPLAIVVSKPHRLRIILMLLALEGLIVYQTYDSPFGIESFLCVNCVSLNMFATLLPLRWCGLLSGSRKEGIDPAIPKADAIANESA